jgi:glycosyltransferase involved in cell wall biosynthesis
LGFIDIALRSIESALRLDFDDYEVIVVDNASGDGSFERIRRFVEEKSQAVLGLSSLGAMRIGAMQEA